MRITNLARLAAATAMLAIAAPAWSKPGADAPKYGTFGIDRTAEDKTVAPGDDFWTFANGSWAKRTAIAADKTSVGYSNILSD